MSWSSMDRGGSRGGGESISPNQVNTPPAWTIWPPSPGLLGELDDDPRRPADVAEAVGVAVALHLADELRPVGAHPGEGGVEVVDGERDVAQTGCVGRRGRLVDLGRRRVELRELDAPVPVGRLHHRDIGADALEPDDPVDPA